MFNNYETLIISEMKGTCADRQLSSRSVKNYDTEVLSPVKPL